MAANPGLNNLDEIMAAAIRQAQVLAEPDLSSQTIPPSTEPAPSSNPPTVPLDFPSGFPGLSALKTSEDMKTILAGSNLQTALTKMAQNSEEMTKIVGSQLHNAPPEVMEQARKLAMGGQGEHIMREMKKKGMDPLAMRAQMQQQKRAARGTNPKIPEPTLAGIHINIGRKAKIVQLSRASIGSAVATILHTDKPVEMSCSRLAQGPLADKIIKVWYDPSVTGKNRRTSKIVGFPIGSDVIVVAVDEDLTVAALEKVEQLLA